MMIILIEVTGHRLFYAAYFQKTFSTEEPVVYSFKTALRVLSYRNTLVFTSVDDNWMLFMVTVAVRASRGLKTVGLVLTPKILQPIKGFQPLVRLTKLFINLFSLGGKLRIITPVPKLDSDALFGDIQYIRGPEWLANGILFDHKIKKHQVCDGKQLTRSSLTGKLFFYGATGSHKDLYSLNRLLDRDKGLDLVFYRNPDTADSWCENQIKMKERSFLFKEHYFTDQELIEMLLNSDFVWACYGKGYDQASGIVATSILLGKVPIVRKGSRVQIDLEQNNFRMS